jgi:hypothetical protein
MLYMAAPVTNALDPRIPASGQHALSRMQPQMFGLILKNGERRIGPA